MKQLLLVSLICLCCSSAMGAGNSTSISITPTFGYGFGTTEYEMNLSFFDTDNNGETVIRSIRSLLEFPLDLTYGGLQVRVESSVQTKHYWYVQASLQRSL
ncbi:MAG: hypothetical protein P1R58_11350, partial [bacterium]|nr:hypothetical protein [bacterium]